MINKKLFITTKFLLIYEYTVAVFDDIPQRCCLNFQNVACLKTTVNYCYIMTGLVRKIGTDNMNIKTIATYINYSEIFREISFLINSNNTICITIEIE